MKAPPISEGMLFRLVSWREMACTGRAMACAGVLDCAKSEQSINSRKRTVTRRTGREICMGLGRPSLHLVFAEVVVAEAFEKFAQFVAGRALGKIAGLLRGLQHLIFDKDGTVHTQCKRERVGGAGINAHHPPFFFQPNDGEESVVFEFGYDHFMNEGVEAGQDVLDEVVRHGAWRCDFLDFERDGVGFVDADPDWKHRVAADVFEEHDWHVGDWVHHEATNFHFDFHKTSKGSNWWLVVSVSFRVLLIY